MPWPDSSTYTSKLFASPRKAIPVGAFNPATKTDAVNPAGRTIFGGKVGLKKAVLSPHCGEGVGFAMIAASVVADSANSGAHVHAAMLAYKYLNFILHPPPFPLGQGELHELRS